MPFTAAKLGAVHASVIVGVGERRGAGSWLRALFPTRPATSFGNNQDITFPKLDQILTFSSKGKVDFKRATPLFTDAQIDRVGELGAPKGMFHEWMRTMLRWSNNNAASKCILALGYFYLNGALARAGLFDAATSNGLWLSADYKSHDWVKTDAERQANAAGPLLTPRWATAQRRRRSNGDRQIDRLASRSLSAALRHAQARLESDFEYEAGEFDFEWEGGRDPSLAVIAERIAARRPIRVSAMEFENEKPAPRWTRCFKIKDVERVRKAYQDNAKAAGANSADRCSCIVMLNVALGQLLGLKTKQNRARSTSTRKVEMGALTTETIEKAMAQLGRAGYASPAITIDFFDRRNKTAGTLKPERLMKSVQKAVLDRSTVKDCWYAYALSIMDGYHSGLLLVDMTGKDGKIYWLDQFSSDINDEVTTTLDARITTKTQAWWQAVKDTKNVGYDTPARVWPLLRPRSPGASFARSNVGKRSSVEQHQIQNRTCRRGARWRLCLRQ